MSIVHWAYVIISHKGRTLMCVTHCGIPQLSERFWGLKNPVLNRCHAKSGTLDTLLHANGGLKLAALNRGKLYLGLTVQHLEKNLYLDIQISCCLTVIDILPGLLPID